MMWGLDFSDVSPAYAVGQILGFLITFVCFFIYYGKSRKQILIAKLTSDLLNVIQQALIGAYTGSLINMIATVREIVFYHRGKRKWASSILWLFLFLGLMGAAPLLTWNGPISLLPAVGSAFAVIAFYVENPTHTRIIGVVSQGFWLAYVIFTVNLGAILQNIILITSAILGLIRDFLEYRKKKEGVKHEHENS